jgi:hypothetical protein
MMVDLSILIFLAFSWKFGLPDERLLMDVGAMSIQMPPVSEDSPAPERPFIAQSAAGEPVKAKSKRLYIFFLILGLAIYAVSFALNAVRGADASSTSYSGWFCARFTLTYTWNLISKFSMPPLDQILSVFSMVISGWINPIFLLSLFLRIWRQTRATAAVLTAVLPALQICCWIVFVTDRLIPREGYFLWVAGMLIVPFAAKLARGLGK